MVSEDIANSRDKLIVKLQLEPFLPKSLLSSGWAQTVATQLWPHDNPRCGDKYHYINLRDSNQLCLVEMKPASKAKGIILLVHGLNGDYRSHYIQRMASRSNFENLHVYCLNLRNCGPSLGYSSTIYNAGNSSDIIDACRWIRARHMKLPLFLCGYSLGGNICLKAIGEDHESLITQGAVVSAPIDLLKSAQKLALPQNRIFNQNLLKHCINNLQLMNPYLTKKKSFKPRKSHLLRDFDENVTAPLSGYKNAEEYYKNASALNLVDKVRVPVLILSSLDDPLVDHTYFETTQRNNYINHLINQNGGHLGFIQYGLTGINWLEDVLCAWFRNKITPISFDKSPT